MTEKVVLALAAQKWANLVECCCPEVTRTEWYVSPAEIAITAWLTPRDGELGEYSPEMVEIVASSETVDDYMYAPELARVRADAKLVEFVIIQRLHSSPRSQAEDSEPVHPEQWCVTSTRLGLQTHHPRWHRRLWKRP
jgi:hypothetical protein